jgi:hypothetical protein
MLMFPSLLNLHDGFRKLAPIFPVDRYIRRDGRSATSGLVMSWDAKSVGSLANLSGGDSKPGGSGSSLCPLWFDREQAPAGSPILRLAGSPLPRFPDSLSTHDRFAIVVTSAAVSVPAAHEASFAI